MPPPRSAGRRRQADRVWELRLDRPHLASASTRRELALLHPRGTATRATVVLNPRDLEPAAVVHHGAARWPGGQRDRRLALPGGGAYRPAPGGLVGRSGRAPFRARARYAGRRPTLRDQPGRQRDARPRLGQHRDLPHLGRLGRVLRPRLSAPGGPERLWHPRPVDGHQPLRTTGIHRSPDAVVRRDQQVHRGRLPRWSAA
jgi:hypothetical protein